MLPKTTTEPNLTKDITLLQALVATPAELACMLGEVDEAAARQAPGSRQWAMADILSHLIDVETRYRVRLERVIQEERPDLPAIWPDEAAHAPTARPAELIERFRAARMETLAFLGRCSPEQWQRPAVHETFGPPTFRLLVQNLVDHDTLHLNQFREAAGRFQPES